MRVRPGAQEDQALVLIGIEGSGKSATANTLANDSKCFLSEPKSLSKSSSCCEGKIINSRIKIIDTPAVNAFSDSGELISYLKNGSFDNLVYGVVLRIGRYRTIFEDLLRLLHQLPGIVKDDNSDQTMQSVVLIFTCANELCSMQDSEACNDEMKSELKKYIQRSPLLREFSEDIKCHFCIDNKFWSQSGKNAFIEEITNVCELLNTKSKKWEEESLRKRAEKDLVINSKEIQTEKRSALILIYAWNMERDSFANFKNLTEDALRKYNQETGNKCELTLCNSEEMINLKTHLVIHAKQYDEIYIGVMMRVWSLEDREVVEDILKHLNKSVPKTRLIIRVFDEGGKTTISVKETHNVHELDFVKGFETYYITEIVRLLSNNFSKVKTQSYDAKDELHF
ncbi:hypothetical protein FSP39_007874 [Pinctada imbricata]|uniref:AIG1-type G domain-containing protein n=1 Tax=Pinctada imbricata TaxID=66713 RepID=A0AA88XMS9_PINIB|nr:hypothetical protein FSP39_007874 [Pinctada imbricata]